MVKFDYARDEIDNSNLSVLQLDNIPVGDAVLGRLICPACDCHLVFRHSGQRKANLATRGTHEEDCPYGLQSKIVSRGTIYSLVGSSKLTSPEQKSRSANAFYAFRRKWFEEQGEPLPSKRTKKKSSVKRKLDPDADVKTVPMVEGTVANGDNLNNDVSRKRVSYRDPNLLRKSDIGKTFEVAGLLDEVSIDKHRNYATIQITSHSRKIKIVFNEALFKEASINYIETLSTAAELFLKDTMLPKIVSALVEVIPDNLGDPVCMVRNENSLLFNGREISRYISSQMHKNGD